VGGRPHFAGGSHGRRCPAHHGGRAGCALPPVAGKDLRGLVRHRPVPCGCSQPCGQLAPAAPPSDQTSHRHSYHVRGTGGSAAVRGGDLPAPAGRPDKRLYQVRQHCGSGPPRADGVHQGPLQAKRPRWAPAALRRPTRRFEEAAGGGGWEPLLGHRPDSHKRRLLPRRAGYRSDAHLLPDTGQRAVRRRWGRALHGEAPAPRQAHPWAGGGGP
jgi:hypothetical protein